MTVIALLATLVLIFAFQAENQTTKWFAVILLAIPILIQVYFNSGLTYLVMLKFKVPHKRRLPPSALIGASNFFELALACFVGVLGELPVMLSVCKVCNNSRAWYGRSVTTN